MPLIVVANSPDKSAALAGLERWKSKHPEIAGFLAVDDVLVDSMRGRSSTWTRIRINLRHVPEEMRPPQETPDPDDDPTREWRQWRKKKPANRERCINGDPGLATGRKNCRQLLRRNDFELGIGTVAGLFVGSPPAKLRRMTEAASLHVIVCDFHNQFGPQRFPRQILALAPAALPARHAFDTFTDGIARLRPCLPRVGIERIGHDTN